MPIGNYMKNDSEQGAPFGINPNMTPEIWSLNKLLYVKMMLEGKIEQIEEYIPERKYELEELIKKNSYYKPVKVEFRYAGVDIYFKQFNYADIDRICEALDLAKDRVHMKTTEDGLFNFFANWNEHQKRWKNCETMEILL